MQSKSRLLFAEQLWKHVSDLCTASLKHNLFNRKQPVDAAEGQMFPRSIAKYVLRYGGSRLLAWNQQSQDSVWMIKVASFWYGFIFIGSLKS